MASGPLTAENGATVSGTVEIYNTGSSTFVIRLDGLTLTAANSLGLYVIANASPGGDIATFSLRSDSGSQNYTYTAVATQITWAQVRISTNGPSGVSYAVATLTTPG